MNLKFVIRWESRFYEKYTLTTCVSAQTLCNVSDCESGISMELSLNTLFIITQINFILSDLIFQILFLSLLETLSV